MSLAAEVREELRRSPGTPRQVARRLGADLFLVELVIARETRTSFGQGMPMVDCGAECTPGLTTAASGACRSCPLAGR